jgi:hypothetical protein
MNHTLVKPQTIAKIKKLNTEIQGLREVRDFVGLKPKQALKLTNKENKLSKILKQL